ALHYRIHLWDDSRPARALGAATLCGQSAPAIAHMWHMPGHTFSKVDRLPDAAWQQEAATRVDHAYMIRTQLLPDQIHNYAHNTEWLIRTYNQLGRAHEAAKLAKNMVEIPRHPEYNDRDNKNKSAGYGRTRLLETLLTWELWDDLLALDGSPYLDLSQNPSFEANRMRALGVAAYFKGDKNRVAKYLAGLDALPKGKPDSSNNKKKGKEAAAVKADEVKTVAKTGAPDLVGPPAPAKIEELKKDVKEGGQPKPEFTVTNAKAELKALIALLDKKNTAEVQKLLEEVKDNPKERLIRYHLDLGDKDKAAKLAEQLPMDAAGLTLRVDALIQAGEPDEAKKHFEKLRKVAASLDADVPMSVRIDAIATQFGAPVPWRRPEEVRTDSGVRPALETLGPVHWHPFPSPSFVLPDISNHPVSSEDFKGKPTIVLFYLGHTCTHCMEQLKAFSDAAKGFASAGIDLVAIGSEEPVDLSATAETCKTTEAPPIRLLADPEQRIFRQWRCYDDFEGMPLHGAFLLDAKGQVRWLDVSPDPFTNTKFLLEEAQRLLKFEGK
ncbi:MAG: redoxin domain-containing protein, partial [Verrucomicrobium sp.]